VAQSDCIAGGPFGGFREHGTEWSDEVNVQLESALATPVVLTPDEGCQLARVSATSGIGRVVFFWYSS
jgi:hypothetical protein